LGPPPRWRERQRLQGKLGIKLLPASDSSVPVLANPLPSKACKVAEDAVAFSVYGRVWMICEQVRSSLRARCLTQDFRSLFGSRQVWAQRSQ